MKTFSLKADKHFTHGNLSISSKPWIVILLFIFINTLFLLISLGKVLNILYPVLSLAVAIFLFTESKILYLGFNFWIWILTPLVRRIIDYQSTFHDPSPVLLTPYVVSLIVLLPVIAAIPKEYKRGSMPFLIIFFCLVYSLFVGLVLRNVIQVSIGALDWFTPVILGFYISLNWKNYNLIKSNLIRIFKWSILLNALYGIYQYFYLPKWDQLWVINTGLKAAGGQNVAAENVRIWGTLNSGEPFAAFMTAGLLLLLFEAGNVSIISSLAGYISFLLSRVRSAWVAWVIGLLVLLSQFKPKHQIRILLIMVLLAALIIPIASNDRLSGVLGDRLQTFSNLQGDGSVNARRSTYSALLSDAITNYLGEGLGGKRLDSNLLAMLFNLGSVMTVVYLFSLALMILPIFYTEYTNLDPFFKVIQAVIAASLVRIPVNSSLVSFSGFIFWYFLGLGLAGIKYWNAIKHSRIYENANH